MSTLNERVARLRSTRVALRAAIRAAYRDPDPGFRAEKLRNASAALASTEEAWTALMAEQAARADRIDLAQLRHQGSRPAAAPVRRSVPTAGYRTKILVPGR